MKCIWVIAIIGSILVSSLTASQVVTNAAKVPPMVVLAGRQGALNSVAFSPDSSRLVSAGVEQIVRVWDVRKGMELCAFKGHLPKPKEGVAGQEDNCVFFLGDSDHVVSLSSGLSLSAPTDLVVAGGLFLWDVRSPSSPKRYGALLDSAAPSPDARRVAAVSSPDGSLKIVNAGTFSTSNAPELKLAEKACPKNIQFSSDGKTVAATYEYVSGYSTGAGGFSFPERRWYLECWSTESYKSLGRVGDYYTAWEYGFTPDGKHIVSLAGTNVQSMSAENVADSRVVLTSLPSDIQPGAFAIAPNARVAAVAATVYVGNTIDVKLWIVTLGQPSRSVKLHTFTNEISKMTFSPDSLLLAVGDSSGTIRIWSNEAWDR